MCKKTQKTLCDNKTCELCISRSILKLDICQQLIDEFDVEKNNDIELLNLPYGSHKKIYWKCKNNHTFYVSLNSRTNGKTSCKICKYDERSKDLELKKLVKSKISNYNHNTIKNTVNINGLKNEEFVYNLLKNHPDIKEIKLVGHLGGFADIVIKLNNCKNDYYYLIQVKTLTKINETSYYLTNDTVYQNNLLIAMVDNSHKYFAIEFAGNINVKRLSLYFNYNKSKYLDIMFRTEQEFTNKIFELLYKSQFVDNIDKILSEQQKKEFYMRERLKQKCKLLNLLYVDNNHNYNTVDCYINNIPIQLKYSSLNQNYRNTIQITMRKSLGSYKGKILKQSYHIDDEFKFVIIELDTYHNEFCIIPKQELANKNCISTNDKIGSGMCYVMPPGFKNKHWTNLYWDNWKDLYVN
jgi:hypothetical protein